MNEARSNMYMRVSATSKKSQKAVFKSMTHTYINILVIAAIEIVFYFALPPMVDWLKGSFGGSTTVWVIAVLGLNFLVLTIPTYYLINNVKFLDEIIISGAKRIANMEGSRDNPSTTYERFQKFLEVNTYLLILGIDFAIVLIVPNAVAVPWWYYLLVFAAGVAIVVAMYLRKRHGGAPEDGETVSEEETSAVQEEERRLRSPVSESNTSSVWGRRGWSTEYQSHRERAERIGSTIREDAFAEELSGSEDERQGT